MSGIGDGWGTPFGSQFLSAWLIAYFVGLGLLLLGIYVRSRVVKKLYED
jgi:hypothetical protein